MGIDMMGPVYEKIYYIFILSEIGTGIAFE